MFLPNSSAGQELLLAHRRVILDVTVVGNATAASVRHASDVPGAVFLKSEGKDDVSAQDSAPTFGTIENNNAGASILGVLIHAPKCLGGKVLKLYSLSAVESGTSTAGTVTVALKGASSTGISADGNLAFTIAGSAANLAADTVNYRVTLECRIEEDKS